MYIILKPGVGGYPGSNVCYMQNIMNINTYKLAFYGVLFVTVLYYMCLSGKVPVMSGYRVALTYMNNVIV